MRDYCFHFITKRQQRDNFSFQRSFCIRGMGRVSRQTLFSQLESSKSLLKALGLQKGLNYLFLGDQWKLNWILIMPTQINVDQLNCIRYWLSLESSNGKCTFWTNYYIIKFMHWLGSLMSCLINAALAWWLVKFVMSLEYHK